MIALAGTVRIQPGMRDTALPHIRAMVAASSAESGCLRYSFAFDVDDDHLVHIFEVFESNAAREAHRNSAHMKTWREAWPAAGIGDRDMMEYDVSAARKI
jgi:quinol monooxygenase YgiN